MTSSGNLSLTRVTAQNNGAEAIVAANVGDVMLDTVITNADISITGADQITVTGTVDSQGGEVELESTGAIQINSSVTTGGGNFTARADTDLTFGAGGTLATEGGTVVLRADADGNANGSGGSLTMTDGSWANSGSGTITLGADGDITVSRLVTTNATSSSVTIVSTSGALLDSGDTGGSDIVATAADAVLMVTTATGIGATDNALETDITTLIATITGSGDVNIVETDALDLADVFTNHGGVTVTSGGPLLATNVNSSSTDDDTNDISLTTTVGDISVLSINAGNAGDVTLITPGAITGDGTEAVEVTADELTATTGGAITLDTTVGSIEAASTTSGAIDIDETDSIDLNNLSTVAGIITIDAVGDIAADNSTISTSGDAISIVAGEDVEFDTGNTLTSGGGTITINAGEDVKLGEDNQITSDGNVIDIDAGDGLLLGSNNKITSGSGAITIDAGEYVSLGGSNTLTSGGGNVIVHADVDGDGSGGVLTMANGDLIDAGSGTITLSADGNITVGRLVTTNDTAQAVTITSASGALFDAGDTGGADIVAAGTNAVVTITTGTGIGAAGQCTGDGYHHAGGYGDGQRRRAHCRDRCDRSQQHHHDRW